ncbi:FAD-linked sulfhydryl oxidase ALR [Cladochytrium replicatum]|nr:FAD-linked sulfhydryl oxidase ALR [Cladochytrium replicatum]
MVESTENTQKPCKVCTGFKDWAKNEKKEEAKRQKNQNAESTAKPAVIGAAAAVATGAVPQSYRECPPDSTKLGSSTWTFLHTMSAYYPETPSQDQQSNMIGFLNAFSTIYPCNFCASHLRSEMKKNPPKVASNWELSLWMCQTHNEVNRRLNKPEFDCSKVFERWKDGPADGSCD